MHVLGLLDRLWDLIERIQAWLTWGGLALAALGSLFFLLAWVFSVVRRPSTQTTDWASELLSHASLWTAYAAVAMTVGAAATLFIPGLGAFTLKVFAAAILSAAVSWTLGMTVMVLGAPALELRRSRKALILAGCPWYCLAAYLATLL